MVIIYAMLIVSMLLEVAIIYLIVQLFKSMENTVKQYRDFEVRLTVLVANLEEYLDSFLMVLKRMEEISFKNKQEE